MTRWLLRLWPEGIAARLGLLLLAGLAVFGIVAGLFYLDERRDRAVEHFSRVLSVRMLAIVELLEDATPEERRQLLTALSDRRLRIRLLLDRPQDSEWQPPGSIDEDAGRHLRRLEPRPVLVRFGDTSVGEQRGRPRIMIAVGLENGVWAEFAVRPGYWPRASAVSWTTAP